MVSIVFFHSSLVIDVCLSVCLSLCHQYFQVAIPPVFLILMKLDVHDLCVSLQKTMEQISKIFILTCLANFKFGVSHSSSSSSRAILVDMPH